MPHPSTVVLIKPDGVKLGYANRIKRRYTEAGLRIVFERQMEFTEALANEFYAEHKGRPDFLGLIEAMTSGPLIALVLEGEDAIGKARALNGATNPKEAAPGTIRKDFKSGTGPYNVVHASDSPEAFERELQIIQDVQFHIKD